MLLLGVLLWENTDSRGRELKELRGRVCHISSFNAYKSFLSGYSTRGQAQLCRVPRCAPPCVSAMGYTVGKRRSCGTAPWALLQRLLCSDNVAGELGASCTAQVGP